MESALLLVPATGIEPVRFLRRGILSPLCLPIPPCRHRFVIVAYIWIFVKEKAVGIKLPGAFWSGRKFRFMDRWSRIWPLHWPVNLPFVRIGLPWMITNISLCVLRENNKNRKIVVCKTQTSLEFGHIHRIDRFYFVQLCVLLKLGLRVKISLWVSTVKMAVCKILNCVSIRGFPSEKILRRKKE